MRSETARGLCGQPFEVVAEYRRVARPQRASVTTAPDGSVTRRVMQLGLSMMACGESGVFIVNDIQP
ncbi:MAG: hypothetical protein M5R40_11085 [Anaerolineae bacterium]|nr:hypothetical protein [Anaerolineae bacterium]